MVGRAVATIVWSSAAISMPSKTATKMKLRRCGLTATLLAPDSAAGLAAIVDGVALVMPASPWGPMLTGAHGQATAIGRARWSAGRPRHALRRVQLLAQLLHQLQLRLEVVDVLFLVGDDLLQQDGAGAVLLLPAHDDSGLEPLHHLVFDGEIGLELLAQRLADAQREEALVVRQPVEQQDAIGDLLGVPHLVERLFAGLLGQLGEAPVVLHLGMQEVLVDRGELAGELLVEQAQNVRITLHGHS